MKKSILALALCSAISGAAFAQATEDTTSPPLAPEITVFESVEELQSPRQRAIEAAKGVARNDTHFGYLVAMGESFSKLAKLSETPETDEFSSAIRIHSRNAYCAMSLGVSEEEGLDSLNTALKAVMTVGRAATSEFDQDELQARMQGLNLAARAEIMEIDDSPCEPLPMPE